MKHLVVNESRAGYLRIAEEIMNSNAYKILLDKTNEYPEVKEPLSLEHLSILVESAFLNKFKIMCYTYGKDENGRRLNGNEAYDLFGLKYKAYQEWIDVSEKLLEICCEEVTTHLHSWRSTIGKWNDEFEKYDAENDKEMEHQYWWDCYGALKHAMWSCYFIPALYMMVKEYQTVEII